MSSSTVRQWLKDIMGAAGFDLSNFKAHSVRGASTSVAASRGITTEEILEAADWITEFSFRHFRYKPVRNTAFAKSVLSAINNTLDMWDEAFWNIITEWLRPQSGCMLSWLYEEGEVKHINSPTLPCLLLICRVCLLACPNGTVLCGLLPVWNRYKMAKVRTHALGFYSSRLFHHGWSQTNSNC